MCADPACQLLVTSGLGQSGEAERGSGTGLKLFGFTPESAFTFIPDNCSESSRNRVHVPPESPYKSRVSLGSRSRYAFVRFGSEFADVLTR